MIEKVARAIAAANGDNFDETPEDKGEWVDKRGEFGGGFRDVNAPFRVDYVDMARAAIEAVIPYLNLAGKARLRVILDEKEAG